MLSLSPSHKSFNKEFRNKTADSLLLTSTTSPTKMLFESGGSGWQQWALAFDGSNGRWQWWARWKIKTALTVATMDNSEGAAQDCRNKVGAVMGRSGSNWCGGWQLDTSDYDNNSNDNNGINDNDKITTVTSTALKRAAQVGEVGKGGDPTLTQLIFNQKKLNLNLFYFYPSPTNHDNSIHV